MIEGSINGYVPKFVGHYDHWAELMENLLRSKKYWNVVDRGIMVDVAGEATTRNSLNTNGITDGIFYVGIFRSKSPTDYFRR